MSGNESIESRSECFVNRLFNPGLLLFRDTLDVVSRVRTESCVTVVCDSWEAVSAVVSVAEDNELKVSTEAIVDNLCSPVVGGGLLGNAGKGLSWSSIVSLA